MLKNDAREILLSSVESVKPSNIFGNVLFDGQYLRINNIRYDLSEKENVYILGSGKASLEMARQMKSILGARCSSGLIISSYHEDLNGGIEVFKSSHPLPDVKSFEAGKMMLQFVQSCKKNDFIVYLLSGGTSSLMEVPVHGLGIEDINFVTDTLMKAGADIAELNTVRKRLSVIKGGGLSSAFKCEGVSLVLSDVVGDDLEFIGSAPLYSNRNNDADIAELVDKFNMDDHFTADLLHLIKSDIEAHKDFNINHFILGNNYRALKAAETKSKNLGYDPVILTSLINGKAFCTAELFLQILQHHEKYSDVTGKPICFIAGGETTVEVKGSGTGGRNQEMALRVLSGMRNCQNIAFGSIGTDGIDGNSDAAGAVVVPEMFSKTASEKIDSYLKNNDSNAALGKLEALIKTGPTGTNVCDVYIGLVALNA